MTYVLKLFHLIRIATLTGFAAAALFTGPAYAQPVTGALFTTTNPTFPGEGGGHCKNGNEAVNCNIYDGKQYVWLSGGPLSAVVDAGEYFFAVLVPRGQNTDVNDGNEFNLSDVVVGGDAYTNRTFSIANGIITYSGLHDFDPATNKIRLMPYDDTINRGGVYILAICATPQPANPAQCKYDAFKVQLPPPPPPPPPCDPETENCTCQGECVTGSQVTLTKTAEGSYDKSWTWNISKTVSNAIRESVPAGSNQTFSYVVSIDPGVPTYANGVVQGEITVVVRGTSIASAQVLDELLALGSSCALELGTPQLFILGETVQSYACTFVGLPPTTNTIKMTWKEVGGDQTEVTREADGQADIDYTFNEIDECVTVSDSLQGALGGGTVCASGGGQTFTYDRTVPAPNYASCLTIPNIASFTTNDTSTSGSSNASVKICSPALGGLTIGYWGNTNGQNVIKNNCGGVGSTSLKTFLTGFNPFKDITYSSCQEIATKYVLPILNAATAKGASMVAMLRAQMLATALDVYFSDGTLGGVRIPAAFPIGNASVDLAKVCRDLSCATSPIYFLSVADAFGSPSCQSVGGLLAKASAAASAAVPASNGGPGSIASWYPNKTVQEQASRTFDGVNNNKVTACTL